MSRIRTIKPDAFTSLSLAKVPVEARWMFAGMWTMADDDGRLPDHPGLIRSQVYPVDDFTLAQVRDWLDALVAIGSVCRYEVDGEPLLHIPGFPRHQVINRPTASRLPECPTHPAEPKPRRASKPGTGVQPTGQGRLAELLGEEVTVG